MSQFFAEQSNPFGALFDRVLASADPYLAAALHPSLAALQRLVCESQIFARRRYPRLFAQATYTPASLLQRLAQESDDLILDKLVKNSSTPDAVLQQLYQGSDDEGRLQAIAAHPNASESLLDRLDEQRRPILRQALCHNHSTGLPQLYRILPEASLAEGKGIVQNPFADTAMLDQLWHRYSERYLRAEIASHANCSLKLLAEAVMSDDPLLRRKSAANPRLSAEQRTRLLSDLEAPVRAAVLRHLDTGHLRSIDEPARRVRRELARQKNLDESLIEQLADDEDTWVRRWIARHTATPGHLLKTLAIDNETEVRRGVARNPNLSSELCRRLAADSESWVRAGIAFRSDLEPVVIRMLANDVSIDVLAGLGRNPGTPEILLAAIAQHSDRDVRRAVILNPQAPPVVLRTLVEDPYGFNRAQLCRHPNMNLQGLWQLFEDPEPMVRFTAVQALASRCETSH